MSVVHVTLTDGLDEPFCSRCSKDLTILGEVEWIEDEKGERPVCWTCYTDILVNGETFEIGAE